MRLIFLKKKDFNHLKRFCENFKGLILFPKKRDFYCKSLDILFFFIRNDS